MRPIHLYLAVAAIALMACGDRAGAQSFELPQAGTSASRARVVNPFATLRFSRFAADRLGLPTSRAEVAQSVFSAEAPSPLASTAAAQEPVTVAPSIIFTASSSGRPPFRPAVRSPFRPPPRPPF